VFTRALHGSLSRGRTIQSIQNHSISLRSSILLSSHLRLKDLLVVYFLSHKNPTRIPLLLIRTTCPTHLILLGLIILSGKSTNYEAHDSAVFRTSYHFIPLRSKYSPRHPFLQTQKKVTPISKIIHRAVMFLNCISEVPG
jgi:hypothetical protein